MIPRFRTESSSSTSQPAEAELGLDPGGEAATCHLDEADRPFAATDFDDIPWRQLGNGDAVGAHPDMAVLGHRALHHDRGFEHDTPGE